MKRPTGSVGNRLQLRIYAPFGTPDQALRILFFYLPAQCSAVRVQTGGDFEISFGFGALCVSIEHEMQNDPYAKEAFSALLRKVIEQTESLFDHPLKQYMLFQEFEEQVARRKLDAIPSVFEGRRYAQGYYGVLLQTLSDKPETESPDAHKDWVDLAFEIDLMVEQAVQEHSLNRPDMEKKVRLMLLPRLFGAGVEPAKCGVIAEHVIQIMRVGPASAAL